MVDEEEVGVVIVVVVGDAGVGVVVGDAGVGMSLMPQESVVRTGS